MKPKQTPKFKKKSPLVMIQKNCEDESRIQKYKLEMSYQEQDYFDNEEYKKLEYGSSKQRKL